MQMGIYNFRFRHSTVPIGELKQGRSELRNILRYAANAFGMPEANLGIPVILANDFSFHLAKTPTAERSVIHMQASYAKLLEDPVYFMAYLVTASTLSKTGTVLFGIQFNPNGTVSLIETLIAEFRTYQQAILQVVISA